MTLSLPSVRGKGCGDALLTALHSRDVAKQLHWQMWLKKMQSHSQFFRAGFRSIGAVYRHDGEKDDDAGVHVLRQKSACNKYGSLA